MTPGGFFVISFILQLPTELTSVFCLQSYTKAMCTSGACCCLCSHLLRQHLTNSLWDAIKVNKNANFFPLKEVKKKKKKAFSLLQLCKGKKIRLLCYC